MSSFPKETFLSYIIHFHLTEALSSAISTDSSQRQQTYFHFLSYIFLTSFACEQTSKKLTNLWNANMITSKSYSSIFHSNNLLNQKDMNLVHNHMSTSHGDNLPTDTSQLIDWHTVANLLKHFLTKAAQSKAHISPEIMSGQASFLRKINLKSHHALHLEFHNDTLKNHSTTYHSL